MNEYAKPLPELEEKTRPFWDGMREQALRLQRCQSCEEFRYPISDWCPRCLSESFTWTELSGRGLVASTLVFHQIYHRTFAGDVPYNVSLIQLDEGPRMISNVVGVPPSDVTVGDRVAIVYDEVTDEVTIPRFEREGVPTFRMPAEGIE